MAAEERCFATLERRLNADRRSSTDRRHTCSANADLYQRLEEMRVAVASDRRCLGRRVTDR